MTEQVQEKRRGCSLGWLEVLIGAVVLLSLAAMLIPVYRGITSRAKVSKDIAHAKSIVLGLRFYAADHDGAYPQPGDRVTRWFEDGESAIHPIGDNSNSVFMALIPEYLPSENFFFSDTGGYERPTYDYDLKPGENHYSYVTGMSDIENAELPLLFSAPQDIAHPFRWESVSAPVKGRPVVGAALRGRIVVVYNDASAGAEELSSDGTLKRPEVLAVPERLGFVHPLWPEEDE